MAMIIIIIIIIINAKRQRRSTCLYDFMPTAIEQHGSCNKKSKQTLHSYLNSSVALQLRHQTSDRDTIKLPALKTIKSPSAF